jgi:hypothetical protein
MTHRSYRTPTGVLVWAEGTRDSSQILLRFRPDTKEQHTLTVNEDHLEELVASGALSSQEDNQV